jgi:hypothetical protein
MDPPVLTWTSSENTSWSRSPPESEGDHHHERYSRTHAWSLPWRILPGVHEQHRQRTAAHAARLASNAEKMVRLQSIGSVPPALGNVH